VHETASSGFLKLGTGNKGEQKQKQQSFLGYIFGEF
jgi:hypothetical protein